MTEIQSGTYDFNHIETKWQEYWQQNKTFAAGEDQKKRKYYVLDMFPYPSGDGLHVGHPEGYTASDIVSRYMRMRGYNVLHPMGFDAFGLPAEQYAIQTGVHPRITTERNINNIRKQIKRLGFSYDWDREINTTDEKYYRWTQWIFLQLFNSYFDASENKAKPIAELVNRLESGELVITLDNQYIEVPARGAMVHLGGMEGGCRKWSELSPQEQREFIDEQRLAYQAEVPVNWCPALGTVLANEEVIGGVSERGGHPVVRKPMRQWMLRITAYADRLLEGLDGLDWPGGIKKLQADWIGKSVGANVDFVIDDNDEIIRVFTTRPDTLFGATYMVLAPEHPLVDDITTEEYREAVIQYRKEAASKSDLDRTDLAKEKTGVFTGAYAVNPVNDRKIPIWISDYVLISYGTGAIMAVPAHDTRDFEFAKLFKLPIIAVVEPTIAWLREQVATRNFDRNFAEANSLLEKLQLLEQVEAGDDSALLDTVLTIYRENPGLFAEAFTGLGIAINSDRFDGLETEVFKNKITDWLSKEGTGKRAVNYKLRDWLFSRQRYWGEPIPIVHLEDGSIVALEENELPLTLPEVESFQPSGNGESPLATMKDWLEVEYHGQKGRRETNTMPQWAGSCWYYLRYIDTNNEARLADRQKESYWMPVDLYVGGAEHAVLHLLYARFWHMVLYDLGHVSTPEPFSKLVNQGMILGLSYRDKRGALVANDLVEHREGKHFHKETGEELEEFTAKMSKSLKNVVNPDEVIHKYGADAMRLYEMFMGPLGASKPWSMQGVEGVYRFLQKTWRMIIGDDGNLHPAIAEIDPPDSLLRLLHKTIQKVTRDIEEMSFNTAISQMMIFVNEFSRVKKRPKQALEQFVLLLSCFAPHIAEELWQRLGHTETLAYESWPEYDEALTQDPEVEMAVQILGKVRDKITVPADSDEESVRRKALESPRIKELLQGKTIHRVIVIKKRLVNIVAD